MKGDLALPAFELDCRDWLVVTPEEFGLPEELAGAPLVAVLSTALIGADELRSVSAVLTLGLFDEDPAEGGSHAAPPSVLVETGHDSDDRTVRYVLPAPDRQLALLAQFRLDTSPNAEVSRRIKALMDSFRWAA